MKVKGFCPLTLNYFQRIRKYLINPWGKLSVKVAHRTNTAAGNKKSRVILYAIK